MFAGIIKKLLKGFTTFLEITHIDVKKEYTISIPVKTEEYSEPFQIFDMELFAKRVIDYAVKYFCKKASFIYLTGF